MERWAIAGAAVLALGGCMSDRDVVEPEDYAAARATSASANVRDGSGRARAQATATQVGDSIRLKVEAADMAPGTYAAHIHTAGRCDAPGFTSAGDHWNPTMRAHGKDNPAGMHMGDLPNLLVGTDGRGSFEVTVPAARLAGSGRPLFDRDGAALVVHAMADDYRTDPSGNSGARIACGVFR